MRTALFTIVAVVVVLACILGWDALATKAQASREVARSQINKVTSDDIVVHEMGIELRKAGGRIAEAQVELDDLVHQQQSCTSRTTQLQADLAKHQEALKKARILLDTNQPEYSLNGQCVSRARLEQDLLARVKVCQDREAQLATNRQEAAAYEQAVGTYRAQLDKSKAECQAKAAELTRLQAELRTARVIEGLSTRLSSLANLQENSNLARLTSEVRKRIGRSRVATEGFASADSGLLDLSGNASPSAQEVADEYLRSLP
jgi:chromosome segregation ATPase